MPSRPVLPALKPCLLPMILWLASGLLVLLAAQLAASYPINRTCSGHDFGFAAWFSNWDGQWYNLIATQGYHYSDARGYGPQVFFPLYPLLGAAVSAATGAGSEIALLLVSWLASAGLCCAWMRYAAASGQGALWGLALLLFWPCAYFLRVDYTESLYMFLLCLFLLGMAEGWRLRWLVLLCGLLTAIRPTGIVCSLALALYLWRRRGDREPLPRAAWALAAAGASAWGMLCYMLYLWEASGDPLLFLSRQLAWNYSMPAGIFWLRLGDMLTLRPVWILFTSEHMLDVYTVNYAIQNGLGWVLGWVFLYVGWRRKWLPPEEILLCGVSLLLFYYFNAPKGMESVGRYVYSLLPLFLVMGRCLAAAPIAARYVVITLLATLLAMHTGMFRLMYCMY